MFIRLYLLPCPDGKFLFNESQTKVEDAFFQSVYDNGKHFGQQNIQITGITRHCFKIHLRINTILQRSGEKV